MNDSESSFLVESEIAGHATDLILTAYDRNLTHLGDYALGQENIIALDGHYENENLSHIVGTIRKALRELVPDCDVVVESESLKRMVWQVFRALKLYPIQEKDKKGQITVYRPDVELSEVFGEPSDTLEYHNRVQVHLDNILGAMYQEFTKYTLNRFDALEDFFMLVLTPREIMLSSLFFSVVLISGEHEKK